MWRKNVKSFTPILLVIPVCKKKPPDIQGFQVTYYITAQSVYFILFCFTPGGSDFVLLIYIFLAFLLALVGFTYFYSTYYFKANHFTLGPTHPTLSVLISRGIISKDYTHVHNHSITSLILYLSTNITHTNYLSKLLLILNNLNKIDCCRCVYKYLITVFAISNSILCTR